MQSGQCVREALRTDVSFLGRRDETRKAVLSTRPGNQNLGTKSDFWGVSAVSTNSLRSVLTKAEPNLGQDSSKSCNRQLLGPKGSAESR